MPCVVPFAVYYVDLQLPLHFKRESLTEQSGWKAEPEREWMEILFNMWIIPGVPCYLWAENHTNEQRIQGKKSRGSQPRLRNNVQILKQGRNNHSLVWVWWQNTATSATWTGKLSRGTFRSLGIRQVTSFFNMLGRHILPAIVIEIFMQPTRASRPLCCTNNIKTHISPD